MAEPIKVKKTISSAPTPQNTPSAAPINTSHSKPPTVPSIAEEKDLDRAAAAAAFAQNPALLQMVEGRLAHLVGRSSGYIEKLPTNVRRRVSGLKGIQKEHQKLEAAFQEEVLQLEKKYFAKFTPLYERRSRIVNGQLEPTDEEVTVGEEKDEDDDDDDEELTKAKEDTADKAAPPSMSEDAKGIPEFWLSAMKNQVSLADMITEPDAEALKHLVDVRMEYLDRPGFRLIFEFAPNDLFTNKTITKTYFYQEESGYGGDFIYDHAEGDKIDWKEGKDLTVRVDTKRQRNKNTKQLRIVRKTVPTESFFNFFSPPTPPSTEDEHDDAGSDIEERLELDYQLGEDIKEKLIPRAIDWFTGEALRYEQLDDFVGPDDEDEDDMDDLSDDVDNDDDDDDSDEDEDESKPKQEAAECKQS